MQAIRALSSLEERSGSYSRFLQYRDKLPGINPLNLVVDPALARRPVLNVLLPGMAMRAMSGGPNTAINLVYRMAHSGVPVRFISTDMPMDKNHTPLRRHFAAITGLPDNIPGVEIACAFDRSKGLKIGENDVFFASAWWNVQMIKRALALTKYKKFLYIIQDYEPNLYAWSTAHALALETYSLDFCGLICGNFLADYLFQQRVGNFADPGFRNQCAVFEPAIDVTKFCIEPNRRDKNKRKLLFYARPTSAERNLFELALNALRTAVMAKHFDNENWEFLFIGEPVPDVQLGRGVVIRKAPWLDYDGYAALMRSADIVLSLMLSPHTSYPPIEAAASGAIAVSNEYANKTIPALADISPNIVGVSASVEGIVSGLAEAVERVRAGRIHPGPINVPTSWEQSFADVLPRSIAMVDECRAAGLQS